MSNDILGATPQKHCFFQRCNDCKLNATQTDTYYLVTIYIRGGEPKAQGSRHFRKQIQFYVCLKN